ncbi:MAG: hypothetical protein ACD_16C00005G0001 [uncultured bacterium]|nr:MAG: hypothetical protein ACD_16C00005G0001 [uncultured bacterium]
MNPHTFLRLFKREDKEPRNIISLRRKTIERNFGSYFQLRIPRSLKGERGVERVSQTIRNILLQNGQPSDILRTIQFRGRSGFLIIEIWRGDHFLDDLELNFSDLKHENVYYYEVLGLLANCQLIVFGQ